MHGAAPWGAPRRFLLVNHSVYDERELSTRIVRSRFERASVSVETGLSSSPIEIPTFWRTCDPKSKQIARPVHMEDGAAKGGVISDYPLNE